MDEEVEAPLDALESVQEPEDDELLVARSSAAQSVGTGTGT